MTDRTQFLADLYPVISALEADGFALEVEESDSGYDFMIVARAADCEDCLVPKPVLERMIRGVLDLEGDAPELRLHYPGDPAG